MIGEDPNRPTENSSLLLLLAPHSQGSLEIKHQNSTRETLKRRQWYREIDQSEGEKEKRKDVMNQWNPCGLPLIRPPTESKEQSKEFPGERLWNTNSESGQPSSIRCQMKYLPTSAPFQRVTVCCVEMMPSFDTLKKIHFPQRNSWRSLSLLSVSQQI